ncbi:hypothetical protein BROUX41_005141 [Berkeleyomyces rouxiae]|uniref:uncharacterized protein n=1 Tax=Berkeleyomyces rouxiae TaxID=2035830 RepID=UPI003B7A277B
MPLNSLTDAMLASAIAAKRLTPSSTGTSSTAGLHRHSRTTPGATPGSTSTSTTTARQRSPHLLSTLRSDPRAPESDENSAERRRKKHALSKIGAKGKHRHHEGSRKRWREEVTERERKRYEALWASNRGQYLVHAPAHPALTPAAAAALVAGTTPPVHGEAQGDYSSSTATAAAAADTGAADDERDLVANVVVRELWRRSRLPAGELAEVWDLVDRQARGALNKQEFVVGMWLIDQRLRGRKIPHRVQRSVWDTAKTAWSKASSHKGQK